MDTFQLRWKKIKKEFKNEELFEKFWSVEQKCSFDFVLRNQRNEVLYKKRFITNNAEQIFY